jgi:uncharacterized membrane protein
MMLLLGLGLALWILAHGFKRIAPEQRAAMGDGGKAVVAVALVISVAVMIFGYRGADYVPVYEPLPGMVHVNNLLMLIAVFLYGVGGTKGTLYPRMRHPMLWGTVIWAVAHLLVNGDLASVVLFGGLGLWALGTMAAINRAQAWVPPSGGRGVRGDLMNLVGTAVLYALIAGIHTWLGYSPFGGA